MIAISDNVQVRKDKPSGTIIINRPNRCNALSREITAALQQAFEDLYQENSIRAVILTGTGNSFCSGTDLQEIKETAENKNREQTWIEDVNRFQELIEYMLRYPKPIICAVNGWVVGSGLALLLASDIVVADNEAKILTPEANLGLFSGVTAALLAFRTSTLRASNILLSGNPIDTETATSLGLIHETVGKEFVWARAQEIVVKLSNGAKQSHLLIKQMLNQTIGEELFTQLSIGSAQTAAARSTDAAVEGVSAFLEKRAPDW